MARTKPTVLCSHEENGLIYEICAAYDLYAVLYRGKPVKLRKFKEDTLYQGPKYGHTVFPEPGHAVRLAEKLNHAHSTTDFTVVVVSPTTRSIPLSNKQILY